MKSSCLKGSTPGDGYQTCKNKLPTRIYIRQVQMTKTRGTSQ
jgi:hypothetical protein